MMQNYLQVTWINIFNAVHLLKAQSLYNFIGIEIFNVSGKLLSFWGGTIQISFIDIDCIIVFCSLLFVFLATAKKSLNLFNGFFRYDEQNAKTSGSRNSPQIIHKFCTCCCSFLQGWMQKEFSRACFVLGNSPVSN